MEHFGNSIRSGLLGALDWSGEQEPEMQHFSINMGGPSPRVTYRSGNRYQINHGDYQPPQALPGAFAPAMQNAVWNPGVGMASPAANPAIWNTAQQEAHPFLPVAAQAEGGQEGNIPYYMIGERPLNGAEWAYNALTGNHNLRSRHQHFIRNDGNNFGFGPSGIFSEPPTDLNGYAYDSPDVGDKKLRADLIDEALDIFEKQRDEIQEALNKSNYQSSTTWENADELPRYQYNIIGNNCQDFVDEILDIAKKLARKRGVSLYLN